ncbi:MAG: hypothetical protein K2R98_23805 [Gemmataceae bacterium]|nr:hypothetical protein [Gemmataceae bacterium]
MRVLFKAFDSKMASREKLFKHASEFATQVGRERLITMSHSEDRDNIVITIWYWGDEEIRKTETKPKAATTSKAAAEETTSAAPKPVTESEAEELLGRTPTTQAAE